MLRRTQRFLSVMIAVVILFACLPQGVMAAQIVVTDEVGLRNALTAGVDSEILLANDITLTGTTILAVGTATAYTLDLNGHRITIDVNKTGAITIPAGADLTIVNSGADNGMIQRGANTLALINNSGTLTIGNSAMPVGGAEVIIDGGYNNGAGVTAGMSLIHNNTQTSVLTLRTNGVVQQNYNISPNSGGGINNVGEFYMTGGEIRYCTIKSSNTTGKNGGGVFSNGYFEMTGGMIHHNEAVGVGFLGMSAGAGGGVAVVSGDLSDTASYQTALFVMKGGIISENQALHGGGVWTSTNYNSRFYMQGGTIENNTATYGAGVQNNSHPASFACAITGVMSGMVLEAGTIQNNVASSYGGGVENNITSSGSGRSANIMILEGMNIVNNSAPSGAGVSLRGSSTVDLAKESVIDGALIANNQATGNGGGVYISGSYAIATLRNMSQDNGKAISGNSAANGGGIYVAGGANVVVDNSTLFENTATKSGGGVYITGASTAVTLGEASSITGNVSDISGGGVFMASGMFIMADTGDIGTNPFICGNIASEYMEGGSSADDVKSLGGALVLLAAEDMSIPSAQGMRWFHDTTDNRYRDNVDFNMEYGFATGMVIHEAVDLTLGLPFYGVHYVVVGDQPEFYSDIPPVSIYTAGTEVIVEEGLKTDETTHNGKNGVWKFDGWTTGDVPVMDGWFVMPDAHVTLEGRWTFIEDTYVIHYEVVGDQPATYSEIPFDAMYPAGTEVLIEEGLKTDETTHNGKSGVWIFDGWTTGDVPVMDGWFVMPDTDVMLKGSWTFIEAEIGALEKTSALPEGDSELNRNDVLTYTIKYTNLSEIEQMDIILTDVIPSGTTYVSGSATGETVDETGINGNGGTLKWHIERVAAGESVEVQFEAKANGSLSNGTRITNIAQAAMEDQTTESNETVDILVYRSGGGGVYVPPADYTLSFEPNGGTDVPSITRSKGTVININQTTTKPGYTFEGWYSDESLQTPVTTVTLNSNMKVYAKWSKDTIPDLEKEDHFAYVIGYPDGTILPNGNITRAEVATIFFRLLTEEAREGSWSETNPYTDVNANDWYNTAVSTMSNGDIILGYEDGSFGGNLSITRAEFAVMAARFDSDTYSGEDKFSDISGHWASEYINRAVEKGWVAGYPDGTFEPDQKITRAEAFTLINRVLGRDKIKSMHEDMIVWPDNASDAWYYEAVEEATNSHEYVRDTEGYEEWTKVVPSRDWAAIELPQ